MQRESMIWIGVLLIGAVLLAVKANVGNGMGKAYVKPEHRSFVEIDGDWVSTDAVPAGTDVDAIPDDRKREWTIYESATQRQWAADNASYEFSLSRSVGIWVGAVMTLFVLSFLIKDNPLYKFAESVFIGVSAAYWMVVGYWGTLVPNLFAKLNPDLIRDWAMPGLGAEEHVEPLYYVALALGILLLWRLAPVGAWIARWPMAFFIGVFAGLRLVRFMHADFLSQIKAGIIPLWATSVPEGGGDPVFDLWKSLEAVFLFTGVMTCLVYFFFSVEHKGIVGKTARVGIWFLMITFGAAFGYTVMGRIALLAIRLEFLFDDWLWLIDPKERRVVEEVAELTTMVPQWLAMLT